MTKPTKLIIAGIWITLACVGYLGYRVILSPMLAEKAVQQQEEEKKKVLTDTSSSGRYQHHVRFAVDSFSGYGVLRSEEFSNHCGNFGVQLEVVDVADYSQRLSGIKSGEIQMAAFSIDALIKTSADSGELPATIVAVIDESFGADSMWASKQFSSLDALNDPATKFVLVGNSPSETFVHVVRHFFDLKRIGPDPFVRVNSAKEVVQAYKQSKPGEKKVFVTWQPEASQIADNTDYKSLVDSSQLRGYIMDVIVVSRDFLTKNEEVVQKIIQSYFSANFETFDKVKLVVSDAVKVGEKITAERAKDVSSGIRWRNTQENYAHFGFAPQAGYLHVEDAIKNITRILVSSGSIKADPTNGQFNLLYYDKLMKSLYDSNYHPGLTAEGVQFDAQVASLNEEQWKALVPVGTMQVSPLSFARGTTKLSLGSEEILEDLVGKLKAWPQYYLTVQGHAKGSSPADMEAQKKRAESAVEWLVAHGVNPNRIKAESSKSNGSTTVKFRLGQLSY